MEGRDVDSEIAMIGAEGGQKEELFGKFAYVIQQNLPVDKQKALDLGVDITALSEKLRDVLDAIEFSNDFQAIESYNLMIMGNEKMGSLSARDIQQYMRWQGDAMQAMATGEPIPPQPPDMVAKIESQSSKPVDQPPPPQSLQTSPARCLPFTSDDFDAIPSGAEAQRLEAEYERLKRDHKELIGLGEAYGNFDAKGKEAYLEKMGLLVFRWEELMASVLAAGGRLNPSFAAFTAEYLRRSQTTAADFRQTVKDVLDRMREQATRQA